MNKLRVKGFDLFLKQLFLFSFLKKLMRLLLKCFHNFIFVFLDSFLFFLELYQFGLINNDLVLLLKLRPQPVQLILVLSDQSLLV